MPARKAVQRHSLRALMHFDNATYLRPSDAGMYGCSAGQFGTCETCRDLICKPHPQSLHTLSTTSQRDLDPVLHSWAREGSSP